MLHVQQVYFQPKLKDPDWYIQADDRNLREEELKKPQKDKQKGRSERRI